MADIAKYGDWALLLGSTSVPFEKGTLAVDAEPRTEKLQSGSALRPDLVQVIGKRPFIRATLLDPSLVDAWQKVASGETIASVTAIQRSYEENGGLGATYKSNLITLGVIMPVTLSAAVDRRATLEVMALAAFDGNGTGMTAGTDSGSAATVVKAFYLTTATVGSSTITAVKDASVTWRYETSDDEALEPEYYYYSTAEMEGNVTIKDLAEITSARLEDGSTEAVSLLLTNANDPNETVTVTLGNCKIFAGIDGDMGNIRFEKIG